MGEVRLHRTQVMTGWRRSRSGLVGSLLANRRLALVEEGWQGCLPDEGGAGVFARRIVTRRAKTRQASGTPGVAEASEERSPRGVEPGPQDAPK